jgi:hypothetical protein
MLDVLLAVAALAALAGAVTRNPTALALLGSNAFTIALCKLDVPFNFVLWVMVDLVVVLLVMRPTMTRIDVAILALFGPIWVLYIVQPDWWAQAVILGVSAQMFLTFPFCRLWRPILRNWARFNDNYDPWGDLKAYA